MGKKSNNYIVPDGDSHKGKVVLSKCAVGVWVVVTILVIVAVGLLAGLLGKPAATASDPQPSVSTKPPDTTSSSNVITSPTPPDPSKPWLNIRLPSNLVPSHYVVDLQPVLTERAPDYYTFNGSSSVTFMVEKSTPYVIIHSNKLNYSDDAVEVTQGGKIQDMNDWWINEQNQFLVVEMKENLTEGQEYILHTVFEGELAEDLGGLYRSTYENSNMEQIVIATTQMQPTDARKAFPCFDEPALKATFDISLWHEPPNFALSNMPNITTEPMYGNWMKTTFNRTEIMSTYLLAFVVCDFGFVENATEDDVQTRIYARRQQIDNGNGDYARDITPRIIDYFEDYFNVSYPLPKSDQIAVPDFAAGAMENWGLVIYRETALLFDPNINSPSNQQRVAAVVAHELAHQWFGNLISPTWWDELWLNEGFASYVEYIGMDHVEDTWKVNDQFVVSDLHRAMLVDGLTSSRPIVPPEVNTPAEINALFDAISYSKGACIIRMINQFAGDEAFRLGLKRYLDANEFGSVNHNQLFEFWEKAVEEVNPTFNPPNGFKDSMDTWILQMGYPVINMMRDGTGTTVRITQDRFLIDPEADKSEPPSPFDYKWDIPLWFQRQSENMTDFKWVQKDTNQQDTIEVSANDYFIGNYGAFGYYRVNYDEENWKRLIDQLIMNHTVINVKSRGQLLDDAFSLARSEDLPYEIALDLTEFLRKDFEYVPWESALDVLAYFDIVLGRSYVYGPYSNYMLYLLENLYCNVTWEDEGGHLEKFQRVNALSAACVYGLDDCVNNAMSRYAGWMNETGEPITPNLRTTVYCNGVRYGGEEEWDFAWQKYQEETNSQEKAKIQYALTCTRTPWIIQRFLDLWILNSSLVRGQDASTVLEDLCLNEYARDITWDFVRANWDYIYDVYGTGFFSFSGIIESCTSHFSTDFELQELHAFKEANEDKLGSGLRSVEQAIELTTTNINWRKNHEDTVHAWLTAKLETVNY